MPKPTKWTKEKLTASAAKYESVKEWRTNEPSAYATASQRRLLQQLTQHMSKAIDHGKWSEARVRATAAQFSHKVEWLKAYPSAPQAARRLGIYDEVTSHMKILGNKKYRLLYAIFVTGTNLVYVGLTGNPKRRFRDHLKSKRFLLLIERHGRESIVFEELSDFLDVEKASSLEGEYLAEFREQGYEILNRAKTGGVGGAERKWTLTAITAEAQRFKALKDWREASPGSYNAAGKMGVLDKLSENMTRLSGENWTEENVLENAKQFKHKVRWKEAYPGAVLAAYRLGIWDQAVAHMSPLSERGKWTKDKVIHEAQKFDQITKWHNASPGSYEAALRLDVLDECCSHMINRKVHVWTKDLLLQEFKKYKSVETWKKKAPSSFLAARKKGLFGLKPPNKASGPTSKWDKSSVARSAQLYTTRSEWKQKEPSAYQAARRKGWLEDVTSHMRILNPIGKWSNPIGIIENARLYKTKSEWQRESVGAYEAAKKLMCFDEATSHMQVLRQRWTAERVIESLQGYSSLGGWRKDNGGAYTAAVKLNILDEIKQRLSVGRRAKWTTEEILHSVDEYPSYEEWRKSRPGRYQAAHKLGLLEQVKSKFSES